MATLEQLRQVFGGDSDADTLNRAATQLGMSIHDIADEIGVPTGRNRGALAAGFSSGVDDLQGLGYSAIAAGSDAVGLRGARDWANRRASMNQVESQLSGRPDLERVEDVYNQPGKWLPYAGYQVAKQIPNLAASIAAGVAVPEVAVPAALTRVAAVLPRALGGGGMSARVAAAAEAGGSQFAARRAALEAGQTFGKQVVGGGAMNYAQGVGSLYQDAVDGGNADAGTAALAGGLPYALTETLPQAMLVGRIGHGSGFTGNIGTRVAKAAGTQAGTGVASELAQNEMEMAYHGRVSPEEAASRRLNSGVAGGLVQGILGSAGGIRRARIDTRQPVDLTQPNPADSLSLVDYTPGIERPQRDIDTPEWELGMGARDPQNFDTVPFSYETGRLAVRAPIDTGTVDLFSGESRLPPQADGRPEFELTAPDASMAGQRDLDLQPPLTIDPIPTGPRAPRELPFSANTQSPKGQVLQGLVESLAAEGHLTEGADVQASTLIAQGKFAAAKKLIDGAMKDRDAADDLIAKVRESEVTRATDATKEVHAEDVFTRAKEAEQQALALLDKAGRPPREGTKKRQQWDALREQSAQLKEEWAGLTKKGTTNANPSPATGGGIELPAGSQGVQPAGSTGVREPVEAVATPAAAPAGSGAQAGAPVGPNPQRAPALDGELVVEPAYTTDGQGRKRRDGFDILRGPDREWVQRFKTKREAEHVREQMVREAAESEDPVHAVTSESLVQTADDTKDIGEYESSLDELYRRWRDDGDEVAKAFFEANKNVRGFDADLRRVRERAGEADLLPPKKPGSEGKNGLKLGRVQNGRLDSQSKETDDLLRALAGKDVQLATRRDFIVGTAAAILSGHTSADTVLGKAKALSAAALNAKVPAAAEKWLRGNGKTNPDGAFALKQALNVIAAQGPAELRPLATAIARLVPAKGLMVTVEDADYNAHGAVELSPIPHLRLFNGRVSQGLRHSTVLHEALHVVIAARYRALSSGLIRSNDTRIGVEAPKASDAMAQFRKVWDEFSAVARIASRDMNKQSELYVSVVEAASDPDEFFVRALTDSTLQEWMARQEYRGKTLWARFKDWVKTSLLGLRSEGTTPSWLDAALAASDDLMEAMPADAPDFKRLQATNSLHSKRDAVKLDRVATPAPKPLIDAFARVPYAKSTLGQKIQDALFNLAESPWALKWTTNDQIAEGYKHLKPVQDINRATSRMASVANRYLEVAAQTAKKWRALSDPVQLAMQKSMLRTTMAEMHVSIPDGSGKHLSADAAWKHADNAHIEKTPENREQFLQLYQEFNALPPAAKNVYDTVRDDLARQHEATLAALRKSAADMYAGQLSRALTDAELLQLAESDKTTREIFADILGEGGSKSEARALHGLYNAMKDIQSNFGTVRGPYFPLVRFGDHVVVMKAKALTDLELESTSLRSELQAALDVTPEEDQLEGHQAKIDDLRKRVKDAEAAVETAKQDERKYVVEFHESPAQAERAVRALREKNPDADVYRSVKEQYFRGLDGASGAFIRDLQDTMSAALDSGDGVSAEAKSIVLQSMKDLYMRRQPERSALRAELRRMGIEGVQSGQMLRGYAQQARNGAWRISRLLHSSEITEGLQALSQDRRSADAKHVLNEMKARFVGDLTPPEDHKFLQSLSQATYFMHLGFNISYFVTNATQAWVTSLPVMAGRHGIVNAGNSLAAASKDVIRLLSQATAQSVREDGKLVGLQLRLTDEQIASLAKDEGERAMLKTLTDDGVVDITIKHDLGAISDGSSDSLPGKVLEISSAMANYPELYNRLSTALAAYRMEVARRDGAGESKEAVQERAERYAEYIINRTHFNYSPENAPRMMRGQLGRLVFQFKRYQQGMIYLFAKLVKDASQGDKDSMRSLGYLLGMTTAVGGVVSLPIAAPVALAAKVLAAAYPDDDEPEWMQQWYNGMKDGVGEPIAQALVKGLPTITGLDLSGKLGQGNLLNPVAFANTDGKKVFSRDYMTEVGFSLLGPGAALLGSEAQAVGYAKQGDILKAAQTGLPTFLANALKAYDRADRGLATKQGDTIMDPEEFNALSTAIKAIGFENVSVSDMYQNRSAYLEAVKGRTETRQRLLGDYYQAVKSGDADAINAARQAIGEFNERQPADRVKGTDLAASLKTHAKRAAETTGGLRVGKRDRDTYRSLTGD